MGGSYLTVGCSRTAAADVTSAHSAHRPRLVDGPAAAVQAAMPRARCAALHRRLGPACTGVCPREEARRPGMVRAHRSQIVLHSLHNR